MNIKKGILHITVKQSVGKLKKIKSIRDFYNSDIVFGIAKLLVLLVNILVNVTN